MSATKLNEASTFTNVESKRYIWLATVANYLAPTRAEIDAGIDITDLVVQGGVAGFDESTNWIDSGNAGSKYTPKTAGRVSSGDSSIKTYLSPDGPTFDCRSIWSARGIKGTLLFMPQGDRAKLPTLSTAPAKTMDSFAVEIGSISPEEDTEALQQFTSSFGIKKKIGRNISIPDQAA